MKFVSSSATSRPPVQRPRAHATKPSGHLFAAPLLNSLSRSSCAACHASLSSPLSSLPLASCVGGRADGGAYVDALAAGGGDVGGAKWFEPACEGCDDMGGGTDGGA